MRKMYRLLPGIALFFILTSIAFAQPQAATAFYLQTLAGRNPWVVMAQESAGWNTTPDNLLLETDTALGAEKSIMALVAAGANPYDYKGTDYVAILDGYRHDGQIGDPQLLNDDMWGILAYLSAGIKPSDPRITESKNFLLSRQESNGSFSFGAGQPADTNDTAMAIDALVHAGVSKSSGKIAKAIKYLQSAQNADGGFAFFPGSESDAASTAWVMSGLQSAGREPSNWFHSGKNAYHFLESVQQPDGSYRWKTSSESGDPTITAYVTIALNGTGYPVKVYTPDVAPEPAAAAQTTDAVIPTPAPVAAPVADEPVKDYGTKTFQAVTVSYRFEGSLGQFCIGQTKAGNALDVVEQAAKKCGFPYHVTHSSMGDYVDSIGFDKALDENGWLFFVNWKQASVGAGQFQLHDGDYVNWYYGLYSWEPLRLQVNNQVVQKGVLYTDVTVQSFNGQDWQNVEGASIKIGDAEVETDANGQAKLEAPLALYTIFAQKQGFIRSNREEVGFNPSELPDGKGGDGSSSSNGSSQNGQSLPAAALSVTIKDGQILFDTSAMQAGKEAVSSVQIRNEGQDQLQLHADVSGDQLFSDGLMLDDKSWQDFTDQLVNGKELNLQVHLPIPQDATDLSRKHGTIIFWATPVSL